MSVSLSALKSELLSDPLSLGYAGLRAVGDMVATADLLNAIRPPLKVVRPIPMLSFAKFAAATGLRQKLKNNQSHPALGAVCDTAVEMLGQLSITFDLTDSTTTQLLDALVSAGVLSGADKTAVQTYCTQDASRAEALWGHGVRVDAGDVSAAYRSQ